MAERLSLFRPKGGIRRLRRLWDQILTKSQPIPGLGPEMVKIPPLADKIGP